MAELIRLHVLLQELREAGYETPPYRVFREAALDGRFPAVQERGLWHGDRQHKPAIVRALGLKKRTAKSDASSHIVA